MKKRICLTICAALLLLSLVGCGNISPDLPKGRGDVSLEGSVYYNNVEFEYLTETTVKITKEDGTILYVPLDRISRITVNPK